MSSYVVDDRTIRNIVSSFYMLQFGDGLKYPLVRYQEQILQVSTEDQCISLAHEMAKLNHEATGYRYAHNPEYPDTSWTDFNYGSGEFLTPTQLLKSIQCFLYQCSEGSYTEEYLYKTLEKFKFKLSEIIVGNTSEYNEASWG